MKVKTQQLEIATNHGIHLYDVTKKIQDLIKQSEISHGVVTVNSVHTTTAVCINEFESRLMDDVRIFLHQLIPTTDKYLHNDIHLRDCPQDEPENAHSHIASMLLGNSESIIVENGQMQLGQWQSVIFVELDGPRTRKLGVQMMGT